MTESKASNELLKYRAEQLTQAAETVLTRENISRTGLSALSPIAILALAPFFLPDRSLADPHLADYLEDAGLPRARATRLMRLLSIPGLHQLQLAVRLARVGADPARLREMSLAESSEYLVPLLAKL